MSRRTRQLSYLASGLLILLGGGLAVALDDSLGEVASLVLIGVGLVLASAIVYLDLSGASDPARSGSEDALANERARARARFEAQRRAVQRSLALERERERQRERHDALARPAHEAGQHRRRLRSRHRRRPL